MFRVGRGAFSIFALGAIVLGGCSASSSVFTEPMGKFAKAANEAAGSLRDYDSTFDKATLEEDAEIALANRRSVRPVEKDCRIKSERCRLQLKLKDGTLRPLRSDPIDARANALMTGVVTYASGLQSIAGANTAADVKNAIDETEANLLNLAKTGDKLNKEVFNRVTKLENSIGRLASPIADAAAFALEKYLEAQKLQALRRATKSMADIFPSLTNLFAAIAREGMNYQRAQLSMAYNRAYDAYLNEWTNRMKYQALVDAAEALDRSKQIKPETIFVALQQAHATLAEALQNPQLKFDDLGPAVQQVAVEAERLAAIAKAFKQAARPNSN